MRKTKYILPLLLFYFTHPAIIKSQIHCNEGKHRWDVKTGTDADTAKINKKDTVFTNPLKLSKRKRPKWTVDMPRQWDFDTVNNFPVEGSIIVLDDVEVDSWKLETDMDIHVLLKMPGTKDLFPLEFVDPRCPTASKSPYANSMKNARDVLIKKFGFPKTRYTNIKGTIKVVGIGFFDREHNQKGNGFLELHPVLYLKVYPQ